MSYKYSLTLICDCNVKLKICAQIEHTLNVIATFE